MIITEIIIEIMTEIIRIIISEIIIIVVTNIIIEIIGIITEIIIILTMNNDYNGNNNNYNHHHFLKQVSVAYKPRPYSGRSSVSQAVACRCGLTSSRRRTTSVFPYSEASCSAVPDLVVLLMSMAAFSSNLESTADAIS